MAGLIESMLAGGGQGAANASAQNTAAAQNMNLQQMQVEVRALMDQRIAERAKTDMETKHGYDLDLQKERNKPYTTGARGSKAGARSVDFDRWKQDNPDGTWEEFQRLSVDIKSNQEKQITDAALKLKQADPYMNIEDARAQAAQLVMGKAPDRAAPAKPFNLKDFQK
jgi:hypothetical protein